MKPAMTILLMMCAYSNLCLSEIVLPPPEILAPTDNIALLSHYPLLAWNIYTNADATHATLCVEGTNESGFVRCIDFNSAVTNYKDSWKSLPCGDYSWRMQMSAGIYCWDPPATSEWSVVHYFSIDDERGTGQPPPSIVYPTGGIIVSSRNPMIVWNAEIEYTYSGKVIAQVLSNDNIVCEKICRGRDGIDLMSGVALGDGNYTWRIRSIIDWWDENREYSMWSAKEQFVIDGPEDLPVRAPELIAPISHKYGAGQILFTCEPLTNASKYKLVVGTSNKFWLTESTSNSIYLNGFSAGIYEWQIQAQYLEGIGPWASSVTFRVVDRVPDEIIATQINTRARTANWEVIAAEKYQLYVASNISGAYEPLGSVITAETSQLEIQMENSHYDRQFIRLELLPQ